MKTLNSAPHNQYSILLFSPNSSARPRREPRPDPPPGPHNYIPRRSPIHWPYTARSAPLHQPEAALLFDSAKTIGFRGNREWAGGRLMPPEGAAVLFECFSRLEVSLCTRKRVQSWELYRKPAIEAENGRGVCSASVSLWWVALVNARLPPATYSPPPLTRWTCMCRRVYGRRKVGGCELQWEHSSCISQRKISGESSERTRLTGRGSDEERTAVDSGGFLLGGVVSGPVVDPCRAVSPAARLCSRYTRLCPARGMEKKRRGKAGAAFQQRLPALPGSPAIWIPARRNLWSSAFD